MAADQIWHGGVIETLDPSRRQATALAVADGRIIAVGSDADILALAGPGTVSTDLHGRFVMPGLVESHTHALWGACRDLYEVFVGYRAGLDDLLGAIRARAEATPPGRPVIAAPWRLDMRPAMGARPRDLLDTIAPDHIVVVKDATQHTLWCNSLALQRAGIDANSPDLPGGIIERDATGAPNGILAENASAPVRALVEHTEAELDTAATAAVAYLNGLGFTAFKEPMAFEPELRAYANADRAGRLSLHAAAHIVRSSPASTDFVPFEEMERLRRAYRTDNLRTDYAKLFLDGVAPSHTASFIEPYRADSGYDAETHDPDATLLIARDRLCDEVAELDRRGFLVKMHAVGDNAANAGLDAIAAARARNGDSGLRHEIAHSAFVAPADIPRFAELGAIAECSPKLWFPNPVTAGQIAVLGKDRTDRCHPIGDFLKAGAEVTYASDWPAAAPDANPWIGLAGMLTRRDPLGVLQGAVGADQAISLDAALPLFTINGARSLGIETETGSLEAGKWADFIVLDKPLAAMTPEEIARIEVRETWWKGRQVA